MTTAVRSQPQGRSTAAAPMTHLVRHRAGVLVRGLASAAALLLVLAGVPWLLLLAGWPVVPAWLQAASGPSDALRLLLTTRDDGSLFLGVMTAAGWAAWASFAAAVLVELAALPLRRVPFRLPLLGPQQRIAGGLVTSVVVMLSSPLALAAPLAPTSTVATMSSVPSAGAKTVVAAAGDVDGFVLVQRGDTLWQIARDELGDGAAYPELLEANRGITQPDGRTLQDPDHIFPGWRITVPVPAPESRPAPSNQERVAPVAPTKPAGTSGASEPSEMPTPPDTTATTAGSSTPASTPSVGTTGPTAWPSATGLSEAPTGGGGMAGPAQPSAATTTAEDFSDGEDAEDAGAGEVIEVALLGGLGVLTAAGLTGLLRRRRTRQQRHRRSGERLPVPPPPVQDAQRRWAAVQAPLTSAHLDSALRRLGQDCDQRGLALPELQFVRLLSDHIELHLAAPMAPIAPFSAIGEDTVWSVTQEALAKLPLLTWEDEFAPYPSLAAVGADLDGAEVLVDLERAGGLVMTEQPPSLTDADPAVTAAAVTAALIVELATNSWSEDLDVVCVGGHRELVAALGIDRVRWTDDVTRLGVILRAWAHSVAAATEAIGDADLADARRREPLRELLQPRALIIDQTTAGDRAQLMELFTELRAAAPALPLRMVVSDELPPMSATSSEAEQLRLVVHSGEGRLHHAALTITPHRLDAETEQHAVTALRTASSPTVGDVSVPEPSVPPVPSPRGVNTPQPVSLLTPSPEAVTAVDVPRQGDEPLKVSQPNGAQRPETDSTLPPAPAARRSQQHPVLTILGPVDVIGPRGELSAERHRGSILEALAFMALHPHRDRHLFDRALWPSERVKDERRQQLVSRARRWLGNDDDGSPYVRLVNPDGYTLAASVHTDWQEFQDLAASPPTASTEDLERALDLVRGQPFAGHHPRRYTWADDDAQQMIGAIVDVAHELAVRARRDGDALRARRAALKGLGIEPASEQLWRDALGAEHLAGNRAGLEALTDRFLALAEELGGDVEPETSALLKALHSRLSPLDPTTSGGGRHAT